MSWTVTLTWSIVCKPNNKIMYLAITLQDLHGAKIKVTEKCGKSYEDDHKIRNVPVNKDVEWKQ